MEVLIAFLLNSKAFTGELTVFYLKFRGFTETEFCGQNSYRSACQRNKSHERVVVKYYKEGSDKVDECRYNIRDIAEHHI